MAHLHSVYDTDAHFKIDGVTRGVKNASQTKTMLIQHDHNSERFTFELPKMIDGHDMSKCNVVEIHYINIDSGNKTNQYAGVYEVDDFQVSPDSDDVVICSWLISSNATQYVGSLSFVLRFVCSTNGKVDYAWNTAVHSGVFVSKGICNGDMVAEEYADILEKWRHELTSGEVTDERIAEVFEAYMEENPIELPDLSVYVKSVNNSKPDKNGNVTVKIPEPITDYVKTVNGVKPVNGNVTVEIPKTGVQTVNGKTPDANGNVEIDVSGGNVDQSQIDQSVADYLAQNPVSGGMTKTEKNLILQLFRNAAYTSNGMGGTLNQLESLWSGSGDVPDVPDVPTKTLVSISAVYSGGSVTAGTPVTALTGIVVTANYSDGTSDTVTGYTLSGTIAEGVNTVTVTYGGMTTTFTVTGVAESSEPSEPVEITVTDATFPATLTWSPEVNTWTLSEALVSGKRYRVDIEVSSYSSDDVYIFVQVNGSQTGSLVSFADSPGVLKLSKVVEAQYYANGATSISLCAKSTTSSTKKAVVESFVIYDITE